MEVSGFLKVLATIQLVIEGCRFGIEFFGV